MLRKLGIDPEHVSQQKFEQQVTVDLGGIVLKERYDLFEPVNGMLLEWKIKIDLWRIYLPIREDIHCARCSPLQTELLAFLAVRRLKPFAPDSLNCASRALAKYDEEVISTEPFEARLTFTVDEDSITFTLDDSLSVVDVIYIRLIKPG